MSISKRQLANLELYNIKPIIAITKEHKVIQLRKFRTYTEAVRKQARNASTKTL